MKLLRYFNHENIISILDIQKPRNYETFTEVYLIQVHIVDGGKVDRFCSTELGTHGDRHASCHPYTGFIR